MDWENVADVALWAKDNLVLEKEGNYIINEVKIKNLGDGFEVIVAFQQKASFHTPMIVRRVRVDSYGHIVKTDNLNVISTGLGYKVV